MGWEFVGNRGDMSRNLGVLKMAKIAVPFLQGCTYRSSNVLNGSGKNYVIPVGNEMLHEPRPRGYIAPFTTSTRVVCQQGFAGQLALKRHVVNEIDRRVG